MREVAAGRCDRSVCRTYCGHRILCLTELIFQIQVLEKDEQIHELSSKLRDAELKCQQVYFYGPHFTCHSTRLGKVVRASCLDRRPSVAYFHWPRSWTCSLWRTNSYAAWERGFIVPSKNDLFRVLTSTVEFFQTFSIKTRADCLSYALENQRLIEEAREAKQQLVSYRAKLYVPYSIPFRFRLELIIRGRPSFVGKFQPSYPHGWL